MAKSKFFQWFMIFLLAIVVAISLGLVVYYFVQNDETIAFKNNLLKVNADEDIVVEVQHDNARKGTTIELEGYDESILKLKEQKGTRWVFEALAGGETSVTLKTNSSNYQQSEPQQCEIKIGDGSVNNPYYVRSADDLTKIDARGADKHYLQTQDIDLGALNWGSLCATEGFKGYYNGSGYTIFNLTSVKNAASSANSVDGLFAYVAKGGIVTNFTIKNAQIQTVAAYVGIVTGINSGTISKVNIVNSSVESTTTQFTTYVGAIAGQMVNRNNEVGIVRVERVAVDSATTVKTANTIQYAYVGGLVGYIGSGTIVNSYSQASIGTTATTVAGGLVGGMRTLDETSTATSQKANISNSYVLPRFEGAAVYYKGGVVGNVENTEIKKCRFDGVYYASDDAALVWTNGQTANYSENYDEINYDLVTKLSTANAKKQASYTYVTSAGARNVSWDFEQVWAVEETVSYPTLRDGETLQDDIFDPTAAPVDTDIDTQARLQAINQDLNGDYTLRENWTIEVDGTWQTIGTAANPFNGTINGNGATIKFVNSEVNDKTLFGVLGPNAKIENLTITGLNISSAKTYVGGLAEINNGTLNDITVKGTIKANGSVAAGGIVGLNTKLITNSSAESLNVIANSGVKDMFVGGLVGENRGTIAESYVTSTTIKKHSENVSNLIAGGIAGLSTESAEISKARVEVTIDLTKASNTTEGDIAGGIAGKNEDRATITKSQVLASDITAYMVGGIVGYNNGEDTDENNFVSITTTKVASTATLKGDKVGGLAGDHVRGIIENCESTAHLSGKVMAGFAVYVEGTTGAGGSGRYATIQTSFVSVDFDTAVGTAYAETTSVIRGTNFAWYCMLNGESASNPKSYKLAGYINDSVFNNAKGGELCGHSETLVIWKGEDNKGYSESECKNAETMKKVFSTEIWNIEDGAFPTLKF